jgi:hypothetical protein
MSEECDKTRHQQRATYAAAFLMLASLCFALGPLLTLITSSMLVSALWLAAMNVAMLTLGIHAYQKVHDRTILAAFGILICLELALFAMVQSAQLCVPPQG